LSKGDRAVIAIALKEATDKNFRRHNKRVNEIIEKSKIGYDRLRKSLATLRLMYYIYIANRINKEQPQKTKELTKRPNSFAKCAEGKISRSAYKSCGLSVKSRLSPEYMAETVQSFKKKVNKFSEAHEKALASVQKYNNKIKELKKELAEKDNYIYNINNDIYDFNAKIEEVLNEAELDAVPSLIQKLLREHRENLNKMELYTEREQTETEYFQTADGKIIRDPITDIRTLVYDHKELNSYLNTIKELCGLKDKKEIEVEESDPVQQVKNIINNVKEKVFRLVLNLHVKIHELICNKDAKYVKNIDCSKNVTNYFALLEKSTKKFDILKTSANKLGHFDSELSFNNKSEQILGTAIEELNNSLYYSELIVKELKNALKEKEERLEKEKVNFKKRIRKYKQEELEKPTKVKHYRRMGKTKEVKVEKHDSICQIY